MPSGHAYAKALRTVKTCVGSEWCRFGTQDSTQMGSELERALWRMYAPHKVKIAVSGCPRNCAESGIKDVGVIGVDSGWEIYVGRQRRHQDRGRAVLREGENARRSAGVFRRLPAALSRRRLVSGAHRALRRTRRPRLREEEGRWTMPKTARRCTSACCSRSTASPIRGSSARQASRKTSSRVSSPCWRRHDGPHVRSSQSAPDDAIGHSRASIVGRELRNPERTGSRQAVDPHLRARGHPAAGRTGLYASLTAATSRSSAPRAIAFSRLPIVAPTVVVRCRRVSFTATVLRVHCTIPTSNCLPAAQ